MPPLDGTLVQCESRDTLPFQPLAGGSTVFVVGMGGGKTYRVLDWLAADEQRSQPIVVVTPRRNLAYKIENDLARHGIFVHNYLNAPEDITVKAWCRHRQVIISGEQVHILVEWMQTYTGGALIIDEFCTLASSFGGATIRWPVLTMAAIKELAVTCKYTVLMDADADVDGKGEAFLRGIAPYNDIMYVQSSTPALKRTLIYGFKSNESHVHMFNDWYKLSLFRSRSARAEGRPNRTFIGGMTPKQVIDRSRQARLLGLPTACYHGNSSELERKRDFSNPDIHMEHFDALGTSTVMSIGTDTSLKCSWGFFETSKGSCKHGVAPLRQIAQTAGRCGRDKDHPLDDVRLGDKLCAGALFTLIDDTLPEKDVDMGESRVDRKFAAIANTVRTRHNAARRADTAAKAAYESKMGLTVGNTMDLIQPGIASDLEVESCVQEIAAWNEVEKLDNFQCHTVKLFELCIVPTRGFDLQPITHLNEAQKAELVDYQKREKACPATPWVCDPDQKIGEAGVVDRYNFAIDYVKNGGQVQKANCYARNMRKIPKTSTTLPYWSCAKSTMPRCAHVSLQVKRCTGVTATGWLPVMVQRSHSRTRKK